jgi:hypothetical protein
LQNFFYYWQANFPGTWQQWQQCSASTLSSYSTTIYWFSAYNFFQTSCHVGLNFFSERPDLFRNLAQKFLKRVGNTAEKSVQNQQTTVASRPKILQNNSKPAPEKYDWPRKIGGRTCIFPRKSQNL